MNTLKSFLKWKSVNKKKTAYLYKLWLERLRLYCKKPLNKVNEDVVTEFSKIIKERYSPKTAQLAQSLFLHFFKWQKRLDPKALDPYFIQVPRVQPKPPKVISRNDLINILSTIPKSDWFGLQKHTALNLMWDCALRVGELTSLNIEDVDCVARKGTIKAEKNDIIYPIFWSEKTNILLKKYLPIRKELQQSSPALFVGKNNSGWLSERITSRTIQRWLEKYNINPHTIRHSKIHEMLSRQANFRDIHAQLRHSDGNINSVMHYIRWWGNELEDAMRKFL